MNTFPLTKSQFIEWAAQVPDSEVFDFTSNCYCPIAQAIRKYNPTKYISVGPFDVRIDEEDYVFPRWVIDLSYKLAQLSCRGDHNISAAEIKKLAAALQESDK